MAAREVSALGPRPRHLVLAAATGLCLAPTVEEHETRLRRCHAREAPATAGIPYSARPTACRQVRAFYSVLREIDSE